MMDYLINILLLILGLSAGIAAGIIGRRYWLERRTANFNESAANILNEAQKEADAIKKEAILQAKDTLFQMKAEFEKESKEAKRELQLLGKKTSAKRGEPGQEIRGIRQAREYYCPQREGDPATRK